MPFQIPTQASEAFGLFIGFLIVMGIGRAVIHAYIQRGNVKQALQTIQSGRATQNEARQEVMAKMAEVKKQTNRHPLIVLLNAVQNLVLIGAVGYFFHVWMNTTAVDTLATSLGQLWYKAQLGYLAFTGGFVVLRAIAGLSHANTSTAGPVSVTPDKNWLTTIADPSSGWAKLEEFLVAMCFVTVFASAFAAVSRVIMNSK